jgi:hypothetical protein
MFDIFIITKNLKIDELKLVFHFLHSSFPVTPRGMLRSVLRPQFGVNRIENATKMMEDHPSTTTRNNRQDPVESST